MNTRNQMEGEENTSLISSQALNRRHLNNYQTLPDPTYEWNVEIDVKGQVQTGDTESDKFSFSKLMQYSGPGKFF
jgi:natural resistance-associated macrophage protein